MKYVENEISNSTSHQKNKEKKRKKKREEQKRPTSKTFLKLEKFSLVTNYHKLSLLPLVVRP